MFNFGWTHAPLKMTIQLKYGLILFVLIVMSCNVNENSPIPEDGSETAENSTIEQDEDGTPIAGGVNWEALEEEEIAIENTEAEILVKSIIDDVFKVKTIKVAEQVTNAEGIYENVEIMYTSLRGKHASIPLNRCFLLQPSDQIAALAFEIFLSDGADDYKNHLETEVGAGSELENAAEVNVNSEKLIQVIFYDTKRKQLIGKPDGFPIEQRFWEIEGYGDAMSNIAIKGFAGIDNSHACYLTYVDYLVDAPDLLQVFYPNGSWIMSSPVKDKGNISGLSGCDVWIEYTDFKEENQRIIATQKTTCDCLEAEDCEEFKTVSGEVSRVVELLIW